MAPESKEPMREVLIFARGIPGGGKTYPIAGAHPFGPNGEQRPIGPKYPGHDLRVGKSHKLTLEARYIDECLKHDQFLDVTDVRDIDAKGVDEEEGPVEDDETAEEEETSAKPKAKKSKGKKAE